MGELANTTSTVALILIFMLMLLERVLPYLTRNKDKDDAGDHAEPRVTPESVAAELDRARAAREERASHDALVVDVRNCLLSCDASNERLTTAVVELTASTNRNTEVVKKIEKRLMNGNESARPAG